MNIITIKKAVLPGALAAFFSMNAMAVTEAEKSQVAWYGDFDSTRMGSVHLPTMTLRGITWDTDAGPQGMEPGRDDDHLWVLTRKSKWINELDNNEDEVSQRLYLGYQPRMTATNPSKTYTVVTGRDIPAHTLIKLGKNGEDNEIISTFNADQEKRTITDFGGQNATGHPIFLNDDLYIVLDRVHRELRIYCISLGERVQTVKLPTSMHHVIKAGNSIAVALEGNADHRPGAVRLDLTGDPKQPLELIAIGTVYPVKGNLDIDVADMGVHHINFHPDGRHVYLGSAEGNMYVMDSYDGQIVDNFAIGKGAGHTDFAPNKGLVVVSSHKSPYVTVMDSRDPRNNVFIKNVWVSEDYGSSTTMQGHTQGISLDENFFYGAATHEGTFFEVNLNNTNPTLGRYIDTDGANLEQGFMYLSPEGFYGNNPHPDYSAY